MRDALSLLDQAIAYGGGDVREDVVRTMLGAVDPDYVYRIVDALVASDGPALLAEVDAMAARSISFASALDELASLFHRIAVAQAVPAATTAMDDGDRVSALAASMPAESVQLAYQICVQGRADLPLAPDEATGFSMTLLRLLAFEPAGARRTPVRALARVAPASPPAPAQGIRAARAGGAVTAAAPAQGTAIAQPPVALPTDRRAMAGFRRGAASWRRWRRSSPRRPSSSRSTAMC